MTRAPKPKKLHPADAADHARIARATEFRVVFVASPHDRHRGTAATLVEADALAAEYDRLYGQFGRRSGIYAVVDGGSVFVPASYPRS